MSDEKTIQARLKFSVEQSSADQAAKSTQKLTDNLKAAEKQAAAVKQQFAQMRESAERIRGVGVQIGAAGAAILAPLALAAKAYVDQAGDSEQASARWKTAMDSLAVSQMRIGKVVVEEVLPYLEKAADLAEDAAAFVEEHPDVIKAALLIGGSLGAIGALVASVGQLGLFMSGVGQVGSMLGIGGTAAGGAAAGGGLAAVTPYIGPIAAAVVAYMGSMGILNAVTGHDVQSEGLTAGKQLLAMAAGGIGMLGGRETSDRWFLAASKALGLLGDQAEKTSRQVTQASTELTEGQTKLAQAYQQAEREAESQYQQQRSKLATQYSQQQAQELEDFNRNRVKSLRDFRLDEQRTEQEYYRNRLKAARDYNLDAARAEEDHQRDVRRLREQYNRTAEDLIDQRDALGLLRATRDYEAQRRDSDEQFQVEAARRSQDFSLEMADQAEEFAIARAQRLADFQQRLREEQEEFNLRRRRASAAYQQQLSDLTQQYNAERARRLDAYKTQLQDLYSSLSKANTLWQQYSAARIAEAQVAARAATTKTTVPTRDSGGYMQPGLYRNASGRPEFVLDPNTTAAAERIVGRQLTQENALAALSRSSSIGGSRSVVYNDQRRVATKVSAADRRSLAADSARMLAEVLKSV